MMTSIKKWSLMTSIKKHIIVLYQYLQYYIPFEGQTDEFKFDTFSDIDECSSSPCVNNATCVDHINMYNCTCDEGYEGTHCQTGRGALLAVRGVELPLFCGINLYHAEGTSGRWNIWRYCFHCRQIQMPETNSWALRQSSSDVFFYQNWLLTYKLRWASAGPPVDTSVDIWTWDNKPTC